MIEFKVEFKDGTIRNYDARDEHHFDQLTKKGGIFGEAKITRMSKNSKSDVEKTLEQRGNRYGTIQENCDMTAKLMKVIKDYDHYDNSTKPKMDNVHWECLHMIFHKISRMVCGDPWYADNAHDIAGYAKLLEEHINTVNPNA